MSVNRDEALRAIELAEGLMGKNDFTAARKLAAKAQRMVPDLDNIAHMLMVCDVHCAAKKENMFEKEMDWYGILQVEMSATDIIIKKQYRKLALLLHPDKNKFPGAEAAFKLIGEAQGILLDIVKRASHDSKRRFCRKPAPAPSYKAPYVPSYYTKKANVNIRPGNKHQQQKPQAQPAAYTHRPTFWTYCPSCKSRFEYLRAHINMEMACQVCTNKFTASEPSFQSVPFAKSSCQTTSSFPQQNKFQGQEATNEPHKRQDDPATAASSGKASFPFTGSTAENKKGKRKRKNTSESSESSDSESSSESEIDDFVTAGESGSNGEQKLRRSVRSKQQVSYNENVIDDEADLVNDIGEGSQKNIETEREEELEDVKLTHDDDHHSPETLPSGINSNEKIKEVQMESDDGGASDPEEDLSPWKEAKSNLINYDDPEFSDFDEKFRDKNLFKPGQIWALYDEEEGMPRFYAVIKQVKTPDFSVKYTWFEAEEDEDEENETRNLPVSVGKFELGDEQKSDSCSIFSHMMYEKTRSKVHFKVFPKKGQKWALFKNWNLSSESDSPREYEIVEILSDHKEGSPISVGFLCKVKGFSFVYCPLPKEDGSSNTCEIPPDEFCRFSHSIPFVRLDGTEGEGVKDGWYELDPAALPANGSKNPSGEEAAPDQDQDHQSPPHEAPAC